MAYIAFKADETLDQREQKERENVPQELSTVATYLLDIVNGEDNVVVDGGRGR